MNRRPVLIYHFDFIVAIVIAILNSITADNVPSDVVDYAAKDFSDNVEGAVTDMAAENMRTANATKAEISVGVDIMSGTLATGCLTKSAMSSSVWSRCGAEQRIERTLYPNCVARRCGLFQRAALLAAGDYSRLRSAVRHLAEHNSGIFTAVDLHRRVDLLDTGTVFKQTVLCIIQLQYTIE